MKSDKISSQGTATAQIPKKRKGIDVEALKSLAVKFSKINAFIESDQPITPELSKNFVSCTLSDDPYSKIE